MKKLSPFCFLTFYFLLALSVSAQNFTVRDIMAEPSMAGMRPDSQKLSPNGRYVIFAWNPEGKEPRNLYIVDARGGEPRILLPAQTRPPSPENAPPESKLNYGLELNDAFSRSRAGGGGFFGVEFSPDSKRILYPQGNDLNVLDIETPNAKPRRIMRTQGTGGARWLDNDRILYQSSGNYFVLDIKETSITKTRF